MRALDRRVEKLDRSTPTGSSTAEGRNAGSKFEEKNHRTHLVAKEAGLEQNQRSQADQNFWKRWPNRADLLAPESIKEVA